MNRKAWIVMSLAAFAPILLVSENVGAAAAEIEELTEEIRQSVATSNTSNQDRILELEEAIKRGERASVGLRTQIESLQSEMQRLQVRKNELENEKRALEKVQSVLTSGLIGALVTALVAILGVFLNFSRGRAERDLKRLEVIEKSASLEANGIRVPSDIRSAYSVGAPDRA